MNKYLLEQLIWPKIQPKRKTNKFWKKKDYDGERKLYRIWRKNYDEDDDE